MLIVGNGNIITRKGNEFIENGAIVIEGSLIKEIGPCAEMRAKFPGTEFLDAHGGVIMPGLINPHNHIYSAFARGMAIKGYSAANFMEVLEGLWWRMDRCLTQENNELSAYAVFIDSIKNGVTTTFDHHASFFDIPGSLDAISKPAREMGLRACFCYEVSDRDGESKRRQSIEENARFIKAYNDGKNDMVHGMMGLHASFTVSDKTLKECLEAMPAGTGFHVHCAEGPADVELCQKEHGQRIIERFHDLGILGPHTLAVHCVHIDEHEMDLLKESDSMVVHNPESNMNNAVGCGQVIKMFAKGLNLGLGTDGYTNDMFESYKVGGIIHRHVLQDPRVGYAEIPAMLFEGNRKIAGRFFTQHPLGILEPNAYADIIVCDYDPLTPMNGDNCNSHIAFGFQGRSVTDTICNGKVLMRDRQIVVADEAAIMQACRQSAAKLWEAINR